MLGRDKNRVTIKEKTVIKQTVDVPTSEVRQQIRHGTSLLGGPTTTQYTNAQQFPASQLPGQNTQQFATSNIATQKGYTGYTPDPYLTNIPVQQQRVVNYGPTNVQSKIQRKVQQNLATNLNPVTGTKTMSMPVQTTTTGYGTTNPGTMPVGTNVMQRKRSSSSSSSSSEERKKMQRMTGNLNTSNVETLGQTQPYPQNTYTAQMPFQQGNIQSGYGTTQVGYRNPTFVSPMQESLYRSSTQRKGPILGKNLYGQTGFASVGYSIQQPFPGQNVYIEQDPSKISDTTKSKFQKSIM